jgi:hypothetical protein
MCVRPQLRHSTSDGGQLLLTGGEHNVGLVALLWADRCTVRQCAVTHCLPQTVLSVCSDTQSATDCTVNYTQ